MKKKKFGKVIGSAALISAGLAALMKGAQKKKGDPSMSGSNVKDKVKSGTEKAIQQTKTLINKQEKMMEKEKGMLDKAEQKVQQKKSGNSSSNQGNNSRDTGLSEENPANPNAVHSDVSPEDVAKKDRVPSPDADEVEAEKGLDALDHQHRADWQANAFPVTHQEIEAIEAEERGKTGKTQSEQERELEQQQQNRGKKQKRRQKKGVRDQTAKKLKKEMEKNNPE